MKKRLADLPDAEFATLGDGKVASAPPPVNASALKPGQFARIEATKVTIEQWCVLTAVITVDGVTCFNVAGTLLGGLKPDEIYYVAAWDDFGLAPPAQHRTVFDEPTFQFVLLPANDLIRSEAEARRVAEKARRDLARYLHRLRHTFTDSTGQHQVDAAVVAFDGESAELFRMEDKRKITVPVERLSEADRTWLDDNAHWVRLFGSRLEKAYETKAVDDAVPPADKEPASDHVNR